MRMTQRSIHTMFVLAALVAVLLTGCGGGGEGATPQTSDTGGGGGAQTLAWDPPQTHEDNTPLDPYQELDYYEFYVRSDTNFTENEAPVAQVAAVSNILNPDGQSYTQSLTTEFSLGNLLPFTQQGAVYYISIRSVSMGGLKSGFSTPVAWNLT
jgi:hypothetical protein